MEIFQSIKHQGICSLIVLSYCLLACNINTLAISSKSVDCQDSLVYDVTEKPPVVVGGNIGLTFYLNEGFEYLDYKDSGLKNGTRLAYEVIIDCKGSIVNIVPTSHKRIKELDGFLIPKIKSMSDWVPGEQNGQKVKVKIRLLVLINNSKLDVSTNLSPSELWLK